MLIKKTKKLGKIKDSFVCQRIKGNVLWNWGVGVEVGLDLGCMEFLSAASHKEKCYGLII